METRAAFPGWTGSQKARGCPSALLCPLSDASGDRKERLSGVRLLFSSICSAVPETSGSPSDGAAAPSSHRPMLSDTSCSHRRTTATLTGADFSLQPCCFCFRSFCEALTLTRPLSRSFAFWCLRASLRMPSAPVGNKDVGSLEELRVGAPRGLLGYRQHLSCARCLIAGRQTPFVELC